MVAAVPGQMAMASPYPAYAAAPVAAAPMVGAPVAAGPVPGVIGSTAGFYP